MKSFLVCLIAAAGLTLGLEGALGNPAAPAASGAPSAYQDCDKLEDQGRLAEYEACEQQEKAAPATTPGAPSSSYNGGGDYGY